MTSLTPQETAAPYPGPVAALAADAAASRRLAFEFFPPKSEAMEAKLWATVEQLSCLEPAFVSVTYGAGGSTRERTHETLKTLVREHDLNVAAHLTCVAATREDVDAVARAYHELGVSHVVALRGDPPEGIGERYDPHPGGYPYASDLVAGLKAIADFEISVGVYPELHPESADWDAELDNLKRKIDAGATRGITQFFFEAEAFFRFMDRARAAGISIPIVPGIMPVTNFAGLKRMAGLCGAHVPDWLARLFEGLDDEPATRQLVSATVASELCAQLAAEGYEDFHFYTLNRPELTRAICQVLGRRPVAQTQEAAA